MKATVLYKQGSTIEIECDNINVVTDADANTITLYIESNTHTEEICILMNGIEHIKFGRTERIDKL